VRKAAEAGAYDDALWRELSDLGWPGIAVAEEHGGQGPGHRRAGDPARRAGLRGRRDAAAVDRGRRGRAAGGGSAEQQARWLPSLASGEVTGTVGLARDGVAEQVPDAPDAAVIVLVEDGAARVVAREDADVERVDSIDPTRRFGRVRAAAATRCPATSAPAWTAPRWRCRPSSSASASARST
jgi:hypothetical protein